MDWLDLLSVQGTHKSFLQHHSSKASILWCSTILKKILIFTLFCFTVLYWFYHTLTWISHGCTWVPNPEPPSHLPPHIISPDHPCAPATSILNPLSNIDWRFVSYLIVYMFQCHSSKSSHPLPLPQSPKSHYDLKPIAINLSKHPQAGGGARIWA